MTFEYFSGIKSTYVHLIILPINSYTDGIELTTVDDNLNLLSSDDKHEPNNPLDIILRPVVPMLHTTRKMTGLLGKKSGLYNL